MKFVSKKLLTGLVGKFEFKVLFYLIPLTLTQTLQAQQTPLSQTQSVLKNPNERQQVIQQEGERARRADEFAGQAVGGDAQKKEQLYGLSSDVMTVIDQQSGGDPNKMNELLQKAQKNPKAFYDSLPPEIKKQIKGLADDIESSKNSGLKNPNAPAKNP